MRVSLIWLLVIAFCWLGRTPGSHALCCHGVGFLEFTINDGQCGAVGGRRTKRGCSITICGNGEPLVGSFCGRGQCNIFGCDCTDGCLRGDYAQSFIHRNKKYIIKVLSTSIRG
ncbi:hypothetical protein KR009_007478 [Drosophila setifemur]|nr:hypothetical protein KR009_007478 [Drosophila setifemur]